MSLFDRLVVATLPLVPKPVVGVVAKRYVAGETLESAVETIRRLNGEGACATVDLLGEEIKAKSAATSAVDEYLRVLDAIAEHELDCNISVKPTQFGLDIDEAFCRENYDRLVTAARERDIFVRLDMEDHTTTDATLRIFRFLHEKHSDGKPAVGPVFQAYMRRTLDDVAELPDDGSRVRLCKGIYIEPRAVAWKDFDTVRLNFVQALRQLFLKGTYVGIATHDEHLCCAAIGLIHELGVPKDQYEFQMLLGVEPNLRKILIDGGHKLRVYVPYGSDWYLYSVRRLRENPKIAGHVARAILRGE
ncbi:MAG: proline dehydrogenase family protein [Acidobacteriota bacterium]